MTGMGPLPEGARNQRLTLGRRWRTRRLKLRGSACLEVHNQAVESLSSTQFVKSHDKLHLETLSQVLY